MEKAEYQKLLNRLILMKDYAIEDRELIGLSDEEIKALAVACDLFEEKINNQ